MPDDGFGAELREPVEMARSLSRLEPAVDERVRADGVEARFELTIPLCLGQRSAADAVALGDIGSLVAQLDHGVAPALQIARQARQVLTSVEAGVIGYVDAPRRPAHQLVEVGHLVRKQ